MKVEKQGAVERERYDDDRATPLGSYAAFMGVYTGAFAGALLAARAAGRELPTPTLGDLALFGVATHKLSRLLAKDKVTAALRAPFTEFEEREGPAEVEERPRGTGPRRPSASLSPARTASTSGSRLRSPVGSVFAPRATRLTAGVFATVAIADFLQIGFKAGQEAL